MARDIKKYVKGVGVKPVTSTGITEKGELESLNVSGKLNYHNGTSSSPVVTESHAATLTNKEILNPTGIVKGDVGLGNVDNTSDLDKPISTATQTALDDKANETLNNLTTTSINADLIPDGNNTRAQGSSTNNWSVVNTRAIQSNNTLTVTSGDTSGSSTGTVTINSKDLVADGVTGDLTVRSGNQTGSGGQSGNVSIRSGTAATATGSIELRSSNMPGGFAGSVTIASGSGGNTGNVSISTGAATGSRGSILLSGSSINVQGSKLTGLPTPVDTSDAASKAYVDNNTLSNNTPNEINALTVKASPINTDVLLIEDSADSFNKKKITVSSISGTTPTIIVSATLSGNTFAASETLNLTSFTALINYSSMLNTTTGLVTIPEDGTYEFSGFLRTASKSWVAGDQFDMLINSSYRIASNTAHSTAAYPMSAPSTPIILNCTAGQTFQLQLFISSSFGGSLLASGNYSRVTIKKVK